MEPAVLYSFILPPVRTARTAFDVFQESFLHDNVAVKTANTLSDYGGIDQRELMKKYSIILTNPPFAGQIQKDSIRKK